VTVNGRIDRLRPAIMHEEPSETNSPERCRSEFGPISEPLPNVVG
jgi:hypothetical protein